MVLYKEIIFNKIYKKLIYFFISVAVISIYIFFNHSNIYAAVPRCNLNGGALFGSAQIVVKSSNGQPLPSNLAVNVQTDICPGGEYSSSKIYSGYENGVQVPSFDNGSVTNPGYNSNFKDWEISSTSNISSTLTSISSTLTNISSTQLKNYAESTNQYATTFQDFGNIPLTPTGKVYCPLGYGCNYNYGEPPGEYNDANNGEYNGYTSVTFNSSNTVAYINFYQVLDCGFSFLNYNIVSKSLNNDGWTLQSTGAPILLKNEPPSYTPQGTITISPPPPTPTITKSCHNASGSKCSYKVHKKKHTSAPPSTKTPNPTISCSNGICSTTPVCGVNSLLNCTNPTIPTSTGSTLTINGSIVGYGGIYSFRDLGGGDITTPAVSIVFNPDFLSVYNELFISNLGDVIQYWIEPGI